jgi:hypothetical protein
MRVSTISQIGAFTALAAADVGEVDYLALRPSKCSGFDPPLRTTVEAAPGLDGALIFAPYDDAWILTLNGDLVVTTTGYSVESGYREAIDALLASLKSAINALKSAPGDLVHGGGTLKVWKHGPIEEDWDDLETICSVTFSLSVDVFA